MSRSTHRGSAGRSVGAFLVSLTLLACTATPGPPTAGTSLATVDATATVAPTHVPTRAASPSPAPTATAVESSLPHFWMARPIGPQAVNYVDPTYRYGDTQGGLRDPHHGVEFQNPTGTPVLAVADGTVIIAGDDRSQVVGPNADFYGQLVLLELDRRYRGQAVVALYGHLSQTSVRPGQHVRTGDLVGQVGGSGVALGPHLHFEVRVGSNDYLSTRNPELWLKPLTYNSTAWGALSGDVRSKDGHRLYGIPVVIRSLDIDYAQPVSRSVHTYADKDLNGDDELDENFAVSDLPPGTYEILINTTTLYRQVVSVLPNQVSHVEFAVNPPPQSAGSTATATLAPRPTVDLSTLPLPPPVGQGQEHLFFGRPIGAGGVVSVASSYRFGSTYGGRLQTHHGVEFGNPTGTPVIAIGPGTVVWAGTDETQAFGPSTNFYGGLVVLQMAQAWNGRPVVALYGHLNDVTVQAGQAVNAGDSLGHVGATGIALGAHLHFEIRLDEPTSYWNAYNPELWLQPLPNMGALAVRLVDAQGRYLPGVRVGLVCADGAYRFVDTYWDNGVNPDPGWGENGALSDVPAGRCTAETKVFGHTLRESVQVLPGQTAFLLLALK